MAPAKSLPPAKTALVLSFFRTTSLAYTLKDLEKLLPPYASISSMLVKEYLSHLVGESLLSVEKIGSGNWYWSFPADAKRQKLRVIAECKKELERLLAKQEVMDREMAAKAEEHGGEDVGELVARLRALKERREELGKEKAALGKERVEEGGVGRLKGETNVFVDNLFSLLDYVKELSGNDPETMQGVRETFGLEEEMDYLE